jgi:hypothetical protein
MMMKKGAYPLEDPLQAARNSNNSRRRRGDLLFKNRGRRLKRPGEGKQLSSQKAGGGAV